MPDVVYVGLQDDDKIVRFGIDTGAGKLVPGGETPAAGAPSVFAVSPDRRVLYVYVGNRGHNSIAGFAVDRATGRLTPAGHAPTEAVPTAFGLDSGGSILFAAGTASGRLASYRVNGETGALTPLDVYTVGQRPAAVLAVPLGG